MHNDVHALLNAGLLEKAFVHEIHEKYEQIQIHIAINAISRFDSVHVDFMLQAV